MTQLTLDFSATTFNFEKSCIPANDQVEIADPHTLQVGDFIYQQWGYSMTILDFYKVVKVSKSGKSCTLEKVKSRTVRGEAGYEGYAVPTHTPEEGTPLLKSKRIQNNFKDQAHVTIEKRMAWKWLGEPKYFTLMD